jgi:Na+-transporting NADH:ubiquinone oxidoreductase subunit A
MGVHNIRKGLDLPITGAPKQEVLEGPQVGRVALMAADYPYMKPKMLVKPGDKFKRGQPLFEDRKANAVSFTAPAAGTVTAVNRGARRALISVVVQVEESGGSEDQHTFESHNADQALTSESVRALLRESGMWTALRARPHDRVPSSDEECSSIFVTAIDTRPLAGDPVVALAGREDDFVAGLGALEHLTDGPIHLCKQAGADINAGESKKIQVSEFSGKHPAGLVGTHIHALDPVSRTKTVWHIDAQDVAAIGHLFRTGTLDVSRVVALSGPMMKEPRLVRTRIGACTGMLTEGQIGEGEVRVISGSVLGGRAAMGDEAGYVGRYHNQVSALAEYREREFLGWLTPGGNIFSTTRAFLSGFFPERKFDFNTTTNGSHRAMVPIGMFERVMPLDVMPTFLLRALVVDDVGRAEALGALELVEEDLSLCSFVSPGKEDFGVALRRNLTDIWKEG